MRIILVVCLFAILGCKGQKKEKETEPNYKYSMENKQTVVFGGGCFWCIEGAFDMLKGVEKAESGYAGGHVKNPTYEQVSTGSTGHAEVVKITYDPELISYEQLLEVFFFLHDPTQLNRQGNDIGTQYRSVIFYQSEKEKELAIKSLQESEKTDLWSGSYVTEISPLDKFWIAESYHQGYYEANPNQPYCSAVVGPKIEKFRKHFSKKGLIKDNY